MKKKTEPEATEKKRRPTPKEWAEAEGLWASGEVTQSFLAKKFGISEQAVYQHMTRKGVKRGEKAELHAKKVAEEVAKTALDDATIIAARIRETKEDHYKMASGIAKLAWAEILKAKADSSPVSVATNNLKALDLAMGVLSKARSERWAVLGLDKADSIDEDGLPELLVSELTAEQITALRDRDFNEFDDADDVVQSDGFYDNQEDEENQDED